jgi:hypothetical protein
MSNRHRLLAEVWRHLQGRNDVASILREIIGTFEFTLLEDETRRTEKSVQTVIWIKTIFDLQRCYLSGNATGVHDCPPYILSYLLPSKLLFSTIIYLTNVKTRLFSSQTTLQTREFIRARHILVQTLLSGLRLLLLRKEKITLQEAKRLQDAINFSWKDDRLHGVERFMVSNLFAAVLDSVNETTRDNPYTVEWLNARLPSYAAGLVSFYTSSLEDLGLRQQYPLNIMPETFVMSLIHGIMEEDWMYAYWVLFDTLWAVECAITQRYVDLSRQTGMLDSIQLGVHTDETLEQLNQTRTSLIISVFRVPGPMTPTPTLLESLAITLLDWSEDLDNFLCRQDSLVVSCPPRPMKKLTLVTDYETAYETATSLICATTKNAKLWEIYT